MNLSEKACPHCGKPLNENASFCPYCAEPINVRNEVCPPRRTPRRALYSALLILLAAALAAALALWLHTRPRSYDAGGPEAVYPDQDGAFHLCFSKEEEPPVPVPQNRYYSELNYPYRYPVRLYVTQGEDGTLLTDEFMKNVASITAEINCSDAYVSVTCTEPQQHNEFYPNAAAVIFVDYSIVTPGEHEAELVCTITMNNGDVIRLRQNQQYPSISTYRYTAQDAPMDTIQELQDFVDGLTAVTNEADQIYLYLPPVVYEGGLSITERSVSLCGSTGSDGQRTTFTGTIQAAYRRGILELDGIDFLGSGQGVGVRASESARVHLTNCRVAGWETGFLADASGWIVATETVFEDNGVGLCFDAEQGSVSDNFYLNNTFRNNGTAVLLERVPSDTPLKFPDTLFTGNGTDIDNRCGQPLELEEAIFQ